MSFLNISKQYIYRYWNHMKTLKSHQLKGFKEHSEYFGIYGLYSFMVYNSEDYICSHNSNYRL